MAAEKQFEQRVKKFLISQGIYQAGTPEHKMTLPIKGWFTKIWGGGYQKEGIPDLLMCVNGIFFSVELKAPTGRPSDLQKKNTAMINASGGIGIILWPDGFEAFKEIVKGVIEESCHWYTIDHLKTLNHNKKCQVYQG